MKREILIILFITCKVSLAQSFEIIGQDTVNFIDAANLKQGHWIIFNKIKKLPNCPDDAKVEEGKYADSKKIGLWQQFFCNGKVKNELTYNNNRPSGYAKFYYENGKISEEGNWENNRWVGNYKYYYENGQVSNEFTYNEQGKREGPQKYYHPNGKVMIEGSWKDGKEAGVLKKYNEDGTLKSEENYADGKMDPATSKFYDKKDAPVVKEEPKKEEPVVVKEEPKKVEAPGFLSDGEHKTYNPKNGKVAKEGTFKNGGLWMGKEYVYEGDKLVKTITISEGKPAGVKMEK
jgi:antitoxin component YwqK of YwqJK toxin-antitoxin module